MSDTYLSLASHILETRGRPMSAQEILVDAAKFGLLPVHLAGATMHKTLQARITEDIQKNRRKSRFYRTNRGTYFLRALSGDRTVVTRTLTEMLPPGRSRPLPRDRILHFNKEQLEKVTNINGIISQSALENLDTAYHAIPMEGWIPTCVFVTVIRDGMALNHTVGKHSYFEGTIGNRTIGFRAYVDEFDYDLFSEDTFGLPASAIRELMRHVDIFRDGKEVVGLEIAGDLKILQWTMDGGASRLAAVAMLDIFDPGVTIQVRRCLDANKVSWLRVDKSSLQALDSLSRHFIKEVLT